MYVSRQSLWPGSTEGMQVYAEAPRVGAIIPTRRYTRILERARRAPVPAGRDRSSPITSASSADHSASDREGMTQLERL